MVSCILLAGMLGMGALSLEPVSPETRAGRCAEFRVTGDLPEAKNPFDPESITIDVAFTAPSGKTVRMPAFWKEDFVRTLKDGQEVLTPEGTSGWRVRYTPWEPGAHQGALFLGQGGGAPESSGSVSVNVAAAPGPQRGYVRVEPTGRRFFQYEDGTPAPLLGGNLCWPGGGGTYDYDAWLSARAGAGMNFARLWMWPLAFGIEVLPGERLNYNQRQAWRLDHVMDAASEQGALIMLALDYHGIFQDEKDMWGGNDYWPTHPYNQTQGGPCAVQNDFFTNEAARRLYEKRLRYMVGRYGAYPSLLCWEFFNEINNVYMKVRRDDVVRWHAGMAAVLHGMDPFRHPVTTSFGGVFEDRKMWEVRELDLTQYHLYCDSVRKGLGLFIAEVSERFHSRYGRPLVYGEFGATYKNDGHAIDPNDWCLRQGLWSGLLSGSAGTVMPWWWEGLADGNRYPLWTSLARFTADTGFGGAAWHPTEASTPPPAEPKAGPLEPEPGASPFTVEVRPDTEWDDRPSGSLVLRGPEDADVPPLPAHLHGTVHEKRRIPFNIRALFAEGGRRARADRCGVRRRPRGVARGRDDLDRAGDSQQGRQVRGERRIHGPVCRGGGDRGRTHGGAVQHGRRLGARVRGAPFRRDSRGRPQPFTGGRYFGDDGRAHAAGVCRRQALRLSAGTRRDRPEVLPDDGDLPWPCRRPL